MFSIFMHEYIMDEYMPYFYVQTVQSLIMQL